MGHSQIDEFLIVRVFASARRFAGWLCGHAVFVKAIQYVLRLNARLARKGTVAGSSNSHRSSTILVSITQAWAAGLA
jgi:hypothetical protein